MKSGSETRLKNIALLCVVMTGVVSGVALAGWMTKWLIFARISPDYIPMAPSTALCFIIVSGSLLIHLISPQRLIGRIGAGAGIFAVWLFCLYILISFFAGRLPEIEHSIFGPTGSLGRIPMGHMSSFTAISLLLACSSEILLFITTADQRRSRQAAAYFATALIVIGFVVLLGYLFGMPMLYGGTIIPVALPTAIVILFMGVGLLAASGGDAFPARLFMGPSVRSRLMRAFFPVALFAIVFAGWLDAAIMLPFMNNHALTSALVAIISAVIFGIIITKMADAIGRSIDESAAERKRAENALREKEALLTLTGRMAKIGGWEFDALTLKGSWTDEVARIHELDPAQGTNVELGTGYYQGVSRTAIDSAVKDALESGKPYDLELEMITARGSHKWVRTIGRPVTEEGRVVKVQGTFQDITERKKSEEALRESEQRYRSLFDNMLEGFAYCKMLFEHERPQDFIYLEVNDAFEKLTGLKNVVGKKITEVVPGIREADPGLFEIYGRVALTGRPESFEMHVEALQMWFHISVYCPKQGHFVAVFDVITERKRAEQELYKLNAELEQRVQERTRELEDANRELLLLNNELKLRRREADAAKQEADGANKAKSDFLANMSHELRTPLNSILGFSEILQDELFGDLNEKQREYVGNIYSGGKHLLELINDILDLSKVESGKLELDLATVSLENFLHGAMAMLKERAMKHGITMALEIGPGADGEINTDERKLKQIMFNLLSNAVKFTSEGGAVRVSARLTRDEGRGRNNNKEESSIVLTSAASDRPSSIVISVADTGIGIKHEDMDKLFKPFSQVESVYTKTYEGTGLGLALTKRLVEFLGGTIRVESELGKGSVFTFTIPVRGGG
jgi:PAS domain S-box-containing protein